MEVFLKKIIMTASNYAKALNESLRSSKKGERTFA
jgi:hypothetical protein